MLVIPRAHIETIYDIEDALGAELFAARARIARAIKEAFAPDGISTWSSNERGANQEVPHFHLHVYPRRLGAPFPPKIAQPELPVADEILAGSAARIRRAIGSLRTLRPPPQDVLDAFSDHRETDAPRRGTRRELGNPTDRAQTRGRPG